MEEKLSNIENDINKLDTITNLSKKIKKTTKIEKSLKKIDKEIDRYLNKLESKDTNNEQEEIHDKDSKDLDINVIEENIEKIKEELSNMESNNIDKKLDLYCKLESYISILKDYYMKDKLDVKVVEQ